MPDPQTEQLLKAATAAATPEPSLWVRIVQLLLAALVLGGSLAIALILILEGPPPPKEAEADTSSSTTPAMLWSPATSDAHPVTVGDAESEGESAEGSVAEGEGSEAEAGSEGEAGEGESGEAESSESLANLSKQGPWAFAIVALLVGAFIATGKSLNFNGSKAEG